MYGDNSPTISTYQKMLENLANKRKVINKLSTEYLNEIINKLKKELL